MASNTEYLTYVLELLRGVDGISYKKMMGEFLLYRNAVLFGGVYDNRFLIKKVPSLAPLGLKEQIPYPGAKPMLLVDAENMDEVRRIVELACQDLA